MPSMLEFGSLRLFGEASPPSDFLNESIVTAVRSFGLFISFVVAKLLELIVDFVFYLR